MRQFLLRQWFFPAALFVFTVVCFFLAQSNLAWAQSKKVDREDQKRFVLPWERTIERDPKDLEKQFFPRCIFPSVPGTKKDAETMVRNCLEKEKILEPLKNEELSTRISSFVKGKLLQDAWYLVFAQRVPDGRGSWIEVAQTQINATLKKVKGETRVVLARVLISPNARHVSPIPLKGEDSIVRIAKNALITQGLAAQGIQLKIDRYKIRYALGKWRLMAEVKPQGVYRVYVDANSGEFWIGEDLEYLEGSVSGRLELLHEGGPPVDLETVPLPYLNVRASTGEETYTNAAGNFSLSPSEDATLTLRPEGRWVSVRNYLEDPLALTTDITPDDITPRLFLFNPTGTGEEDTAQMNAYYHTTFIHDWLRARGIGDEIDRPITVRVNDSESLCNASYRIEGVEQVLVFAHSGFPSWDTGMSCDNTAFDSIVYHEYGHFVDAMLGGLFGNYGISEGWGDLISAYALNNPVRVSYRSDRATGRRADNGYCYYDRDEIHVKGIAWSGFGWDLRRNLISSGLAEADAISLSEELVIPVLNANPWHPREGVLEVLLRDDDDANLDNGTPHADQILTAAGSHCIGGPGSDISRPAAITDFAARAETLAEFESGLDFNYKLTFTWTAPGDDGAVGTVTEYRLFRSKGPFTDSYWLSGMLFDRITSSLLPGGALETRQYSYCLEAGSTYHFAIIARDENYLFSPPSNEVLFSTPPDLTPPVISGIDVSMSTETMAVISWEQSDRPFHDNGGSDEMLDGAVDYGVTSAYGNTAIVGAYPRWSSSCETTGYFSAFLGDLTPGVEYHFRVRSKDSFGNEAVSEDRTFPPHLCGNGIVEVLEQCDDGNVADGDGCNSTCRREFCGDGIVQAGLGETCDDGNTVNGDRCSSACIHELPRLTIQDRTVRERDGFVKVPVSISWVNSAGATVDYATANSSAMDGPDYFATRGTLVWNEGEPGTKFITVRIVDDATSEAKEKFTVTLSNPGNATVERGTGTVWILDDDYNFRSIFQKIFRFF